jgi:AcrR family transcriptional regulator
MNQNNARAERKKRRTEDNRIFILEAAEKVFIQWGYTQSSVDEIAREAQFSKATIYRYFKSKSEIFIEVIKNYFEELLNELEEIRSKDSTAEDKIKELILVILMYFHRKKNTIRIFYAEKDTVSNILRMDPKEHFSHDSLQSRIPRSFLAKAKEITETTTSIIEGGIESGEFRPVDAEKAGAVLGAMIRGFAFSGPFRSKELSVEKTTEMLHEYFLNGIKNYTKK